MKREILFKYYIENKHTGAIYKKVYSLSQIEESGLKALFDVENYTIIATYRFTGLLDKNGNKIFEGDIVTFNRSTGNWTGQRLETTHEVYFEDGICAFCMKANGSYIKLRYLKNRYIYEITGNIFDK